MSKADEIKKLKELKDQGILSEEEYQKKKIELLDLNHGHTSEMTDTDNLHKKKKMSQNNKIILCVIAAVLVVIVGYLGITSILSSIEDNAMCDSAAEAISYLMEYYGLTEYEVIYTSSLGTSVLCPDFENLSNEEKYALIMQTIKLNDITVRGEEIDLSCDFYVNSRDYYYYVSPLTAALRETFYTCGGIYKYDGNRYCVYEVN